MFLLLGDEYRILTVNMKGSHGNTVAAAKTFQTMKSMPLVQDTVFILLTYLIDIKLMFYWSLAKRPGRKLHNYGRDLDRSQHKCFWIKYHIISSYSL